MGTEDTSKLTEHARGPRETPRVLIVAEHASAKFGGEAILPLHLFRYLRARDVDVQMIVHNRTKAELLNLFPEDSARIHFIPDTRFNVIASKISLHLPDKLFHITLGFASRLFNQIVARRIARDIIRRCGINIVHQPMPVSPREPSLLYDLGVPVVIGPLNGNMYYPPGFAASDPWQFVSKIVRVARLGSDLFNWLIPGKLRASVLLVANERTRKALPSKITAQVIEIPENGVDLSVWHPSTDQPLRRDSHTRYVYVGRLVELKKVDVAIEAMTHVDSEITLSIVGDGAIRAELEALAQRLGVQDRVRFHGFLPQAEIAELLRSSDGLIMPSIHECGGAVVLEAMACALPVVATRWGGPADYLDDSCGILIDPISRPSLVAGFAQAMQSLHDNREARKALGLNGWEKVRRQYEWSAKADLLLDVYEITLDRLVKGKESAVSMR